MVGGGVQCTPAHPLALAAPPTAALISAHRNQPSRKGRGMREKQKSQAHLPEKWDERQVRVALAAARCHAARFARQRRLAREDREDLIQDILLVILEAGQRFDATRASWATFVAVLARRAVIDRARQPSPPACVSFDSEFAADIRSSLVVPQADPDIGIAFGGDGKGGAQLHRSRTQGLQAQHVFVAGDATGGDQRNLALQACALEEFAHGRNHHIKVEAGVVQVGHARRTLANVKHEIDRELKAEELKKILDEQTRHNPLDTILEEPAKTTPRPATTTEPTTTSSRSAQSNDPLAK